MAVHRTEPLPEAPYSLDLLADLHAGVLSESVSDRLWPLVRQDEAAMAVITALDGVSAHLRELGGDHAVGEPMPPEVAEQIDRALDHADAAATVAPGSPTVLSSRRRPRAALAVGVAATVVLAVAVTAAILIPGSGENSETIADGLDVDPDSALVVDSGDIDASFAYRVMADRDAVPLLQSGALADCLAANGFRGSSSVLGAASVELDGRQGVVMVLPQDPSSAGLTLLAVSPDCGVDNPATLLRRDLD